MIIPSFYPISAVNVRLYILYVYDSNIEKSFKSFARNKFLIVTINL